MFQHDSPLQGSKREKKRRYVNSKRLVGGARKINWVTYHRERHIKKTVYYIMFPGGKEQCILQKAYHLSYTVGKKKYIYNSQIQMHSREI